VLNLVAARKLEVKSREFGTGVEAACCVASSGFAEPGS